MSASSYYKMVITHFEHLDTFFKLMEAETWVWNRQQDSFDNQHNN